jgi:diguanylate cyclase (GGDEF)-like protein
VPKAGRARALPGVLGAGRSRARALSIFYGSAMVLAAVSVVLPGNPGLHRAPLGVLCVFGFVLTLVFWIWADRVRLWVCHLSVAFGSIVISSCVLLAGNQGVNEGALGAAYAVAFAWVAVFSALFFSRAGAVSQVLFGAACYTAVLLYSGRGVQTATQVLMQIGTGVAAAGTVEVLVRMVRALSSTDALTKLPNRDVLRARTQHALATVGHGSGVGLLLLDLNRFKEVNDTLGHDAGDQLLIEVAHQLESVVRDTDTVSRLGGDEFVVLLPDLPSREAALEIVRAVRESLLDRPVALNGVTIDLDASVGIAIGPEDGNTFELLLQHADVAMYQAKAAHTGVSSYSPEADKHDPYLLSLLGDLRLALAADDVGLELHYQPKVDLIDGEVRAVEALLRWRHPTYGLVEPDTFVPLAETTGVIRALTTWVVNTAFAQARDWAAAGIDLRIAVNVPARVLLDRDFPVDVAEAARRHDVPASALVVEITERSLVTDPDLALEATGELSRLGVGVSLDDFGTGYSSLSYLGRMALDEIKIDKRFVAGLCTSTHDVAIVRAMVDMAGSFGLRVVAEGVEDVDTWSRVAALGCHSIQGWYLASAMHGEDMIEWIETRRKALTITLPSEASA